MLDPWDLARIDSTLIGGIFDAPYSDELQIQGGVPTFTCATRDVAGDAPKVIVSAGDTLDLIEHIDGQTTGTYVVREIQSDGTGLTVLTLEEQ